MRAAPRPYKANPGERTDPGAALADETTIGRQQPAVGRQSERGDTTMDQAQNNDHGHANPVSTASKNILSRVGKAPVALPAKVTMTVDGDNVTVKGPLGTMHRKFVGVTFEQSSDSITVHPNEQTRQGKALHGLGRNLLRNMVEGVTKGYKRELDVVGVGFRAELVGSTIKFSIGFSHPVMYSLPATVTCKIEKQTHLELNSVDKEVLGQTAATIRGLRPPEPYKGKGIKYTNEVIRMKAGKSGGKGGKKK